MKHLNRLTIIALLAFALLIVCALTDRAGAAPLAGSMGGCNRVVEDCKISADGAGHAASTVCRLGSHFADAHVASYRTFDSAAYYRVRGCTVDTSDLIDRVTIGYKLR